MTKLAITCSCVRIIAYLFGSISTGFVLARAMSICSRVFAPLPCLETPSSPSALTHTWLLGPLQHHCFRPVLVDPAGFQGRQMVLMTVIPGGLRCYSHIKVASNIRRYFRITNSVGSKKISKLFPSGSFMKIAFPFRCTSTGISCPSK